MGIWILTEGRTGSSWLWKMLWHAEAVDSEYSEKLNKRSKAYMFAEGVEPRFPKDIKVHTKQWARHFKGRDALWLEAEHDVKPSFILLDRHDKFAQAVSMEMAMKSKIWCALRNASAEFDASEDANLSMKNLVKYYKRCSRQHEFWTRWLRGRPSKCVFYEDIKADPAAVLSDILSWAGARCDRSLAERAVAKCDLLPVTRDSTPKWIAKLKKHVAFKA